MAKIQFYFKNLCKKWELFIIILSIFFVNCSFANVNKFAESTKSDLITLNFHQTEVAIILQALADSKQLNLIVTDDLSQKQTIKLHDVNWNKALTIILNAAKLQAKIEDNILFVSKTVDPQTLLQKQKITQLEQEKELPLDTLAIEVKHADPAIIHETILQQGILSERGKVLIDKRTNSIIITDLSKRFNNIKKLVKTLDKPIPQVHISAHIVNMSDESMSELGIKWGFSGRSSQVLNKFDVDLNVTNPSTNIGFNLTKISGSLLNLELSALQAENQLEIIASPNLLTANQNMASIKQGTEIPYEVSNGNSGSTSIEFKQAVLGLEVTPKIVGNNMMILDLYITQNTAGQAIKRSDGGESLAIDTQEIKTQVKVKHGETIVLGGIFHQINSQNNHNVPGVSKVPIVGNLFKYKNKKQQKRELVIFITPHLVE
ncbi:type IV pilus secretin PilQ [Gilliamella sp. ESL0441]|uniref:secretin N-terminal domain-containing protein n=1 Tax=Gilliamella sp. ESL0441 TaxID=2704654 RepID=UPI001C6960F7|nr:secretin N-terminal domain-containing protein [Gilliamella sp. ESL0441]QYN43910.1 type IV pilus secretin PilQ [Gilliamella sp. ESL0441]